MAADRSHLRRDGGGSNSNARDQSVVVHRSRILGVGRTPRDVFYPGDVLGIAARGVGAGGRHLLRTADRDVHVRRAYGDALQGISDEESGTAHSQRQTREHGETADQPQLMGFQEHVIKTPWVLRCSESKLQTAALN